MPTAQAGVYYVLVHGADGAALSSLFTLTAGEPGLGIQSLGLTTGGNSSNVTIPVNGTDLTPDTQVTLVSGSTTLEPVSIDFQNASLLYATFDLAGQPTGTYSLHIANGSHSATLSGAFTVEQRPGQTSRSSSRHHRASASLLHAWVWNSKWITRTPATPTCPRPYSS